MTMEERVCQSCGMPISRDEGGGGSLADGTKTYEYCSHCYQNGQFTQPDLTLEEMMARVDSKLQEVNLPSDMREAAVAGIPSLRRWQK